MNSHGRTHQEARIKFRLELFHSNEAVPAAATLRLSGSYAPPIPYSKSLGSLNDAASTFQSPQALATRMLSATLAQGEVVPAVHDDHDSNVHLRTDILIRKRLLFSDQVRYGAFN